MKRMSLFFAVLCALTASTGCSRYKSEFDGSTYINKTIGMRIVLPAGWRVEEKPNAQSYIVQFYSADVHGGILISRVKRPAEEVTEESRREFSRNEYNERKDERF